MESEKRQANVNACDKKIVSQQNSYQDRRDTSIISAQNHQDKAKKRHLYQLGLPYNTGNYYMVYGEAGPCFHLSVLCASRTRCKDICLHKARKPRDGPKGHIGLVLTSPKRRHSECFMLTCWLAKECEHLKYDSMVSDFEPCCSTMLLFAAESNPSAGT